MNSIGFKLFDRRVGALVAIVALLFAALMPVFAMAATVTERSIALSSAAKDASDVTYDVSFKPTTTAGAVVVDFCSESPLIGQACTAPASFDATAATTATPGYTLTVKDSNTIVVTGTLTADTAATFAVDHLHNPSVTGPMYVRLATYTDATAAADYTSTDPDVAADHIDDGGVALSITDSVAVTGAVLESLTFCVSKSTIDANCTNTDSPVLKLGKTTGSVIALTPDEVSTGVINTQISTNAASGAIVSLKSNALGCGGLLRRGAAPGTCNIEPALASGIAAGEAKFGVMTATATNTPSTDATGTFQPVALSGYNNSTYAMNFTTNDTAGVTSTYGDKFLDTDGAPANNKNMALTFGASISNDTPAGLYSADLSMIATGKF